VIRENQANPANDGLCSASEVFRQHGQLIRETIRKNGVSGADEDDLYQEIFLSLASKPISFQMANVGTYLHRAICNDITDAQRRISSYRKRLRKYVSLCGNRSNDDNPQAAVAEKDEAHAIYELAQEHLPEHLSRVFHLRYGQELDIDEIALCMGIGKRTASVYLCCAARRVRMLAKAKGLEN